MTTTIELTKGYTTIIDDIDADLAQQKWCVKDDSTLYAVRGQRINGKQIVTRLHRVIMERVLGRSLGSHEAVDHADHNSLNNCRNNLRLATSSQNKMNRIAQSNNTSGYKGVSRRKSKWVSQIAVNGIRRQLGYYDTAQLAAIAYNHAALVLHGEFARFNDIPGWQDIHPTPHSAPKSSQFRGIHRNYGRGKPWRAGLKISGEYIHVGMFDTEEEAYIARQTALEQHRKNPKRQGVS